jgi:hypothetical protein
MTLKPSGLQQMPTLGEPDRAFSIPDCSVQVMVGIHETLVLSNDSRVRHHVKELNLELRLSRPLERPICGVSANPQWLWHASPARSTTAVSGPRTEVAAGRPSLTKTMRESLHFAGSAPVHPWHAPCLSTGMKEQQTVREFLDSVSVGEPLSFEQLALYPLCRKEAAPFKCITLDEAMAKGSFQVKEVDGGTVPLLLVEHSSELKVPVSCVEEGRWSITDANTMRASNLSHPRLRHDKAGQVHDSLRARMSYESDRGRCGRACARSCPSPRSPRQRRRLRTCSKRRGRPWTGTLRRSPARRTRCEWRR